LTKYEKGCIIFEVIKFLEDNMSGLWALNEDWLEDSDPWDNGNPYVDDEETADEPIGWEEDDDLEEVIPF
jgi:hypothetical protein